jgi:hypothetical protein
MTRSSNSPFLIGRGDMRGAADTYMKKGAHGGNMVSPVQVDVERGG